MQLSHHVRHRSFLCLHQSEKKQETNQEILRHPMAHFNQSVDHMGYEAADFLYNAHQPLLHSIAGTDLRLNSLQICPLRQLHQSLMMDFSQAIDERFHTTYVHHLELFLHECTFSIIKKYMITYVYMYLLFHVLTRTAKCFVY